MVIHAAVSEAAAAPPQPGRTGRPAIPVVINPTDSLTGTGLAAILAERFGCPDACAGNLPVARLGPGLPGLRSGALFTASRDRLPGPGRSHPPGLLLVTHNGPDSGRLVELAPGRYWLGRPGQDAAKPLRAETGILLSDPAMSRVHAELDVSSRGVIISDCGSRNGVWLDGVRVRSATLTTASLVRLGDTSLRITVPGSEPRPPDGEAQEPLTVAASLPRPPGAGVLAGAFLPLGLGIILAVATGMWFFLAFSGLGALTAGAGLVGFRRRRRAFRQAVEAASAADRQRRHALFPSPGDRSLAALNASVSGVSSAAGTPHRQRLPSAPVHPNAGAGTKGTGIRLRLGTGAVPANLALRKPDEEWQPPVLRRVPVTLDVCPGAAVSISGPRSDALGLFRSLLQQLASRSFADRPGIILFGAEADDFTADARLLPGVRLLSAADRAAAAAVLTELAAGGDRPGLLAVSPPGLAAAGWGIWNSLPDRARSVTSLIICEDASDQAPGSRQAAVRVSLEPGSGTLVNQDRTQRFDPDLLGSEAFHRNSVWLASCAAPETAAHALLPRPDAAGILAAWERGLPLQAVIGSAGGTPVSLDLVTDGPHLLVAGTTGSGKSELLRTLVASLACQVPPSVLNFLLIDFKGGSGLAPLAELPHTAGFLTDLSRENVARALTSLRAELRRRESLLARAKAGDLDSFNACTSVDGRLPRLAVVVDEFRMLADTVPTAVEELMRIAVLGRSLGLHLVMATQRPQGAVTADIRANVSACLCLRVQSAADSRDVVGCDDAAAFPASAPGMAVLRLPGGPPLTFQSASMSAGTPRAAPAVQTLAEFLGTPASLSRDVSGPGLDRITAAVQAAASEAGFPGRAPAPVQPPLPEDPGSRPEPGPGCLRIGLADRPEEQVQAWLDWNPRNHSHLGLLGLPASGSQAAAAVLARQHTAFLPARHLYVLDGDGSLRAAAGQPQTGAYVPPHDTGRAARVLAVLSDLVLDRLTGRAAVSRTAPERAGMEAGSAEPDGGPAPPGITVIVSGWGRWQESFRSGRFAGAEDLLPALARDGAAADLSLLITGARELAGARFFPLIPNRLWFPAGLSEDALLSWPRMPEIQPLPGRAFVQGPLVSGAESSRTTVQCYRHFEAAESVPLPPGTAPPRRVDPLPGAVRLQDLLPPSGPDSFPLGLGGDELETIQAQVPPGSVFLVVGPPQSGRTTVLETIAAAGTAGRVFRFGTDDGTQSGGSRTPPASGSLRDWLVLADDADRLPAEDQQALGRLADRGARVVLSAAPSFSLGSRLPLASRSGPPRHGVLLAPAQPADGEFFGVRLDLDGVPRPGRGYVIAAGRAVPVQFAAAEGGGQGP
ncbi:FtsK/SpoIIIE domain-containing protein [Arthrobacter sp. NPDC055585]